MFFPFKSSHSSAVKETDMDISLSRDVRYIYQCEQRGVRVSSCVRNLKKRISRWGGVGKKGFLLMSWNATLQGQHLIIKSPNYY